MMAPRVPRALAAGVVLLSACADAANDETNARIAALETKVEQLSQQLEANAAALAQSTAHATALADDAARFELSCPPPWQALGPAGDAAWTCRADRATPAGLWPNCTVTVGDAAPNALPRDVFEASLASVPQLKAARRLASRDATLAEAPAHEATYEHDLLPSPLRVLATVGVRDQHAYAVTCSAPPEAFAANEPTFRRITASFRFK